MPQVSPHKKTISAPPPEVAEEVKASHNLTLEELEEIAIADPERAQKLINLQDSFKRKRQEADQERSLMRMKLNNLREIERESEGRARLQDMCSRQGHIRPDGETRLQGQYVGQGRDRVLQLTCNYCYKQYTGVGDGQDQLPTIMASRIDLSNYGG